MPLIFKQEPEYVKLEGFQPLPKYGHLSEITPEFAKQRDAINDQFAFLMKFEDWDSLLKLGRADVPTAPNYEDRGIDVEFLKFPARDGTLIELKVYKSKNVQKGATLVYHMHGGGWMVGCHETEGEENAQAAAHENIVVVSVDYRMAPENPFPKPVEDCWDGLLWCKANADKLGINPEKIILGGSSAGANLAPVLALEARDKGVTGIVAQILHFPVICHPLLFPKDKYEFGSYIQNSNALVLNGAGMESAWDVYVPDPKPDHRHSPLLAESHANLPPAVIQCGGLDLLRDEALAYGEALESAGVAVELYPYQGVPHCFTTVAPTVPEVKPFYERFNAFLDKYSK